MFRLIPTLMSSLIGLLIITCGSLAFGQQPRRIPVRIPPQGIKLDAAKVEPLRKRLQAAEQVYARLEHPLRADAGVLLKAVRLALRHNEFYKAADLGKAKQLLELAESRMEKLGAGSHPWTEQRGLVVRGYRSRIDGSLQPYGLHIPEELKLNENTPLIVWLHGRGDKTTDMHFLVQRMKSNGKVQPPFAITVHPFGRHCMGFKSAGELDVLDVVAEVRRHYPIDPNRIVLMGFSMGGAGAWHVGAHYADQWAAVSPGAGFAETARYTRLPVDQYPPWYEQQLWGVYDVPGYVRNLFNPTVAAYSGEDDKQIQAARVMEEAFLSQGRTLTHLIGPKMGHKYHPETLRELLALMKAAIDRGRDPDPDRVYFQTRTLRYANQFWVEALRLDKHWSDTRVDAVRKNNQIRLTVKNVAALRLSPKNATEITEVRINDQPLSPPSDRGANIVLVRSGRTWRWAEDDADAKLEVLGKKPGLQGPIDDAFMAPFVIVTPTGKPQHAQVGRWVEFELDHLIRRWSTLYRADAPLKKDSEITKEDIANKNLILFGDPSSNALIRKVFQHPQRPPLRWEKELIIMNDDRQFGASSHVPVLIYPNPLNPKRYIVINSGPTHREGHDRTNSLQNPKLPDWAILDLSEPPNAMAAGRVATANFFGEQWELRPDNAR